jgi:type I restriction enzyme M protein
MIATGTDVKPLECLLFMRDVKSRNYFEQMKGRGTRTIDLFKIVPEGYSNIHHTFKKNPLKLDDLKDFIVYYNPANRNLRKESYHPDANPEGQWRKFSYEEIIARDKTSPDISWIKDKSLADLENLPYPETIAEEIIENLEAGLESFRQIIMKLNA